MKYFIVIIFLLLLTPVIVFGQVEDIGFMPISLDRHISKLSKKIYNLGNTEKVIPFKNASFSEKMNAKERLELVKEEELVIQIQDPDYPNDAYAFVYTDFTLKFDMSQVRGLGFCSDSHGLRAIIPMRRDDYSGKWRPLFVLKWKDVKEELTNKEVGLVNFLVKNLDTDILPVGWSSLGGKQDFPYFVYFEYTSFEIGEIVSTAFEKLFDSSLLVHKPVLYYDSLFNEPASDFKFDYCDSTRLMHKKPLTYYKNVKYRKYESTMEQSRTYLKVKIKRVFSEFSKNLGVLEIPVTDEFYLKQEDFLPYLPEWMQDLMKEGFVE